MLLSNELICIENASNILKDFWNTINNCKWYNFM